jgi:hypothetical protein
MLAVHGIPIAFCFVAWMKSYDGPKADDIPIWRGKPCRDGNFTDPRGSYFLIESFLFRNFRTRAGEHIYLGDVQHQFKTTRFGGGDRSAIANVVWCAADPDDGDRIKVVGYYENATIYSTRQSRRSAVMAGERRRLDTSAGFNVRGLADFSKLIPAGRRPALPFVPGNNPNGRWQAAAKVWTGQTIVSTEQKRLQEFISSLIGGRTVARGRRSDTAEPDPKLPARTREYLREIRLRNQRNVRDLRTLYGGRCQISGARPLNGVAGDITEVHHIHWLTRGGADSKENMVVLAPDMHAAIHASDAKFNWRQLAFSIAGKQFPIKLSKHLKKDASSKGAS